jgi:hypothetical protein
MPCAVATGLVNQLETLVGRVEVADPPTDITGWWDFALKLFADPEDLGFDTSLADGINILSKGSDLKNHMADCQECANDPPEGYESYVPKKEEKAEEEPAEEDE